MKKIQSPEFIQERINVLGIGQTGCNVINRMIDQGIQGIDFIGVSVGQKCACLSENKVQILDYKKGYNTKKEEKAAIEEGLGKLKKIIDKTDMIFILCDTRGYDGGRIAKDISKLCKSMGILTIAIVNDPLKIEHKDVKEYGETFKNKLIKSVDTLIVLPSNNIIKNIGLNFLSINQMYSILEDYFIVTIRSIADLLIKPGDLNITFEDIKIILNNSRIGGIGIGYGSGKDRTVEALKTAIKNFGPGYKIDKAKSILIGFAGIENNLTINEVFESYKLVGVEKIINKEADCCWGMIDNEIQGYAGDIRVSIIGVGL